MSAMKKLKTQISNEEVQLTIPSMNGLSENSSTIPIDLIIEVLLRLPVKSIARFRCVSKQWASLLRDPNFTNRFLTLSAARPRLLFTFQTKGTWSFFSIPQCLISDHNSSLIVVDKHIDVPRDRYSFEICVAVCGMLCTKHEWNSSVKKDPRMMICNPSTGKSKTLPKVRTRRVRVITYIGYDPMEKQHKVLCMTVSLRPFLDKAGEHQVLTLGTSNIKWRMIECSVPHYPQDQEICINGVLYYLAIETESRKAIIVCFDVRSEKFNFMTYESPEDLGSPSTLVNYKNQLGIIHRKDGYYFTGTSKRLELLVLEDIEEHKWSRYLYEFPSLWKELVEKTPLCIVGMMGTSEILFSPRIFSNPFCIFLLNMKKNSVKRVEIQGIGLLQGQQIYTFINHVENVNLIM